MFIGEAAALEADEIEAAELGGVAVGDDEGGHVLDDLGAAPDHAVGADPAELVDAGEAGEDDEVFDRDVASEGGGVAEDAVISDHRIVGDVDEEQEADEPEKIVAVGEDLYSVSGLVLTEDVERFFGVDIDDEMNDTIGGVVFSEIGRAPTVGDETEIQGLTFRVDSLHGMRIDRLLVRRSKDASVND